MDKNETKIVPAIAMLLLLTVLTQILYIVKSSFKIDIDSAAIWSVEAVTFLALLVLGLVAMVRHSQWAMTWAAIAMGGLFNVIQVGMGLTMFKPLSDAGAALEPAYSAIVAGAFYCYFAGKFLFGFAAIHVGLTLLRYTGAAKALGALAALTGAAAMAVNLGGIAAGMTLLYPAGAAGTLATLLLAGALGMAARRSASAQH